MTAEPALLSRKEQRQVRNAQVWDAILEVPGVAGFQGGPFAFLRSYPGLSVSNRRAGLRVRASLRLAAGYNASDVSAAISAALARLSPRIESVEIRFVQIHLPRGRAV